MQSILNQGAILLISGPSGCGKSSLLKKLYQNIDNYYFSISTTTRKPRDGERNGIDYFFVSKKEFENDIKNEQFLEYANVHGNYYGTSLKPIDKSLRKCQLVIFDIDVQGHKIIQEKLSNITTSVFITTPTLKDLHHRLSNRGTDSKEIIKDRLLNAKKEIKEIKTYDYFIINDDLEKASNQLLCIARASMIKTKLFNTDKIINIWN
ncbi:Guanylate kinase [hydrothermal vent metagenome]|uniref:guanylate kinase n=1 Tax=hydrothermal vent metagenome TaxID=652676 RepID=A0A3B1E6V9_9ZZZZ